MSSYIKLYQIEGGQALENKVVSIENMLENGDFTVNEMNAKNGVIQNNLMVGYTDNTTDLCDNLVMDVSGSTLFHNQVQILGDTIFGEKSSNAEDVSNNDTNLFVYGDLRIMDGGNIIIEDVCNTTITDLRTEVKITDSLDISNDGTSVAMTVRQIETATHDIAHFVDGNDVVFTIGAGGKTYIGGDVSMESSLEISNNLIVHNEMFVDEDVSFGSHLQVVGDVSMESSLEISNNLIVHNEMFVDGDVSFGSHLQVVGDVSMESSLEISNNLIVHTDLFVDKDVSFGGHLQVVDDVSMESSLEISNNLIVHTNLFVDGDVSFGGHLQVVDDVSMESSLEISNNLIVHNEMFVDKDVSFGGHLQVVDDVSMESSLEISNNLIVHNEMFVDKDVSFGENLTVIGDVFMKSVLDICGTITTNKNFIFETNSTEKMIIDTSGMKILNSDPSYSALDISATSALKIPVGYQSQRPTVETTGQMRYNKSTKQFEGYGDTGKWQGLGGIIDVDQDTFILAETQPDEDNDEIQIFTASIERMKVDACGNIQMFNSDPSYSALDISATSALTIPVGDTDERPSVLKVGQIRYNTTNSQFEGYNNTNSWQGLGGVIDIDQDTFIIAQPDPQNDTDQIQIFTDSFERMKVDACGNIQMINSNSTYSALDISATSALLIPGGTKDERPTNSENPRALRFNSDTSLCEVYTESNIWSGLPVYKAEQPPPLLNISQNKLSENVTVNWEKFADIYKDVFDGKCYPIYLQTFVDISFTDISNTSTNGWETIIIGQGNYDETGTSTTPLTTFDFNSVSSTNYNDYTGYKTIEFTDKPQTTADLPIFTQNDSFDLRIYGVNKSETIPNYNYIYNVQLKQTEAPGKIDVISFESFGKTDFDIDLSFNLDSSDSSITSTTPPDGISITNYDVSFTLTKSKSLDDIRYHSGNQYTNWVDASSLSKSDLNVSGLFPGAKYDIQVRAQNALKLDSTSSTGYMYGEYGDVFESSGFTNISGDTTGTDTTQYIEYSSSGSDLNVVSHNALQFSLENATSINCYVNGTNNKSNRTISNSNSYIDITGTSKFYVNYGLQGIDMSGVDNLVQATVDLEICGNSVSSQTITYNGTNEPSAVSADTIDISNGGSTFYQFSSATGYTDEYTTNNYNNGFVYSSTFSRTDSNDLNSVFVDNFPASTDYYYLSYEINSQTNNKYEQIDDDGSTTATSNTGNFYVDDYLSTPIITWIQDPVFSVTGTTVLFGIPSVSSVNLQYEFDVSGFANHIIPTSAGTHSYVAEISKNSYGFSQQKKTGISTNNTYTITFNSTDSSITNDTYDDNTINGVTVRVYYLDNTGKPSISYIDYNQDVSNIGHIFKDTLTSYSDSSCVLYTFDGSSVGTSAIDTDNSDFINTYSSNISSMLLFFNNRFVSGGYSASYSSTSITPFDDWSTSGGGYAADGPDYSGYSNTGINGFKWIVLEIPSSKISGNNVDLGDFKVNGQIHSYNTFTTDYEAYIYQDGVFGALNNVSTTNTPWYSDSDFNSSISLAKSRDAGSGGALQGSTKSTVAHGIDGFINSSGGTPYLIVGLPQNSNSYFTYT